MRTKRLPRRWTVFLLAGLALMLLTGWGAGRLAARAERTELARKAAAAAVLHEAVLRSELEKHRSLPFVLAEDPDVKAALASGDPARVAALNAKLENLSARTRAAAIYILRPNGMTVAASNWRLPTSFVGSDYSFRPYFRDALRNGTAEHFALGTVSGRPGLFLARQVEGPLGVVVVKVEFDALEAEWRASGEPAFVADRNGVVLVTSAPAWRFRTVGALPPAERARLRASLQFGDKPLAPLPLRATASGETEVEGDGRYMAASTPASTPGWTLHLLTPAGRAIGAAENAARALGALFTMLLLVGGGLLMRRGEVIAARTAAQEAARAELEARVEERTRELRTEMEERRRAQARIQTMQDELVQANKLATLGQIAAGVAHEINQPVAAIRTYADNAVVLLDRPDPEPVRKNLGVIASLTERIGLITDELRAFSRKTSGRPAPVAVREAVDGALLLVGAKARAQNVRIVREDAGPDLKVMAERVRLEQVLVNLLQNALEALEQTTAPEIRLTVRAVGRKVKITVADNGPGLSPEADLFTPFATTKKGGLGLGLLISRDIVTEFGGDLAPEPASTGATFVVTLEEGGVMFESGACVAFIDDDEALRAANVQTLELAGLKVLPFASARQALAQLGADFPGVVVSDIRMPEMDGRQLFRRLKETDPDLPVILITGHGDIADAVDAMHEGAYDFVPKPYSADRLVSSVRRALEKRRLVLDNRRLQQAAERGDADGPILGASPVMERLRATVRQLAEADVDVLIEGETGVGKELVATALHRLSRRRSHPFVAIDCAALPEAMIEGELFGHEAGFGGAVRRRPGRIEAADRGSLFLDDLGSLPLAAQGKLLRVVEEREITPLGAAEPRTLDIRILAATSSDLSDLRRDLFYRLNVVSIRIPSLRERREDVPLLFARFLAEASARLRREPPRLTHAVRRRLIEHDWPGNVRELRNFAERVALGLAQSVADAADQGSLPERMERYERELICEALDLAAGDVRTALTALGLPRKTFYDKVQKHRIDIDSYRRRRR